MVTTIQIDEKTKSMLYKLKVHYRQSYNELILRLAQESVKQNGKPKVRELFGKMLELKKWSTQELKDEMRSGWLSDSDRKRGEE